MVVELMVWRRGLLVLVLVLVVVVVEDVVVQRRVRVCRWWMRIRGLWWVLVRRLLQVLLLVLVLLLKGNWEWGNRWGLVGCPGRRMVAT